MTVPSNDKLNQQRITCLLRQGKVFVTFGISFHFTVLFVLFQDFDKTENFARCNTEENLRQDGCIEEMIHSPKSMKDIKKVSFICTDPNTLNKLNYLPHC